MTVPVNSYRPDIDGLRALAVSLVVVFHAGASWLPGGFIGVDVFFVISGYLITGLLVDEHRRTGHIRLKAFWARRVRRLGPALFLVIAVVLPASMIWLSRIGTETGPAAKAALATLLLNANHFFMVAAGDYFAAAAETNPLLHMWSLSVEEQFYLFWPLGLLALLRWRGAKGLVPVVAVALAAALAVAVWGWKGWSAQAQFYLMPSRAWELLAGALLAVALRRGTATRWVNTGVASVVAPLGLGLILFSALTYSGLWGFPFPLGLAPVAGAVLLIWAGAVGPGNAVSRLAALPWVVYLGRISYPLYLWHWPLLVLARGPRLWEPSPWADVAAAAAAVLAAAATYELVEKPWQRWTAQEAVTTDRVLRLGVATTAVLLVCAGLVGAWARLGWGYAPQDRALAQARLDEAKTGCVFRDSFPDTETLASCFPMGGHGPSILLWGDSHAGHWGPAVKVAAAQQGAQSGILALGGCAPLPFARQKIACQRFHQQVLANLARWKQDRGLRGVVMVSRWGFGMGLVSPIWTDRVPEGRETFLDARAHNPQEALAYLEAELSASLDKVGDQNLRVLLVMPSPLQRVKGPHCLSVRPAVDCFVSREQMAAYSGAVEAAIRRVAATRPFVRLMDPKDFMCTQDRCPAMLDNTVVYRDDNHVTDTFSRASASHFLAGIGWLAGAYDDGVMSPK